MNNPEETNEKLVKNSQMFLAGWIILAIMAGAGLGFYLYENSLYSENKASLERLEKSAVDDFSTIEKEWDNYQKTTKQTSYFKWGLEDVKNKLQQKIFAFSDKTIENYRTNKGKVSKDDPGWKKSQEFLEKILANDPSNKDIQSKIAYLKGQQDFAVAFSKGADKNTLFNSAQKYYEEAIRLNPKFGDAYFMIALTHIYGKGRDFTKALENIEFATGNGFPYDKRTKAVKGDCLQAQADATVKMEDTKLKDKNINNLEETHEYLDEVETSLKTIREKYMAAKSLYEEAKGYGTVDNSLKEINARLEKLEEGLDAVDKIHLLADLITIAADNELENQY